MYNTNTICVSLCVYAHFNRVTNILQNTKRGRYCFELRMTAGHKSYVFAAENETEFRDWLSKLSSVLQQNKLQEEKRAASLERGNSLFKCYLCLKFYCCIREKHTSLITTNTAVRNIERFGTEYESTIN